MKPRLFWTMLLAFSLVIVLGVCGMLGFFGLAVSGIWQTPAAPRERERDVQQGYSEFLGDYYVAQGGSWRGIDTRLNTMFDNGPLPIVPYVLLDQDRRVVASSNTAVLSGTTRTEREAQRGTPIQARGQTVGTLLVGPEVASMAGSAGMVRRPPSFVFSVLRGFVGAGLSLVAMLIVLAVVFTRWFSRPLRRLREASLALADGHLDVRVPGARVRELDDLARSFNTMATALSDADRQRRQMTADIAHELRTPLTIIKGRLEGMQDGVYDPSPEQIDRLVHETALLERMVEDLRVLALAEAGQLPLYPELVEPRELLRSAAATFAGQAASQGVALRVDAAPDLPSVQVDPQRIAQVLQNLLANALRYTAPGNSITLHAELAQPATVVLHVSDTGTGIAAADLPQIFNRFWRTDRSRTRGSGGSGLGLAIARQIVVAHGGTISAQSTEGQGTTIAIALPVA